MTFVSYAQNYEDVMLWRAFSEVDKGFFIDVGANAPVGDSVTYLFYERGWRGINIEPVSQWFEMLAEIRPDDINLNAAISATADFLILYDVPDTGLATANPAIAARHRQEGRNVLERNVPAYTLDAVCAKHAPDTIHFLKVDVEGAEAAVLRSINLERYRPQIILVEATLPNSTEVSYAGWEPLITGKRYDFAYFDGLNRFYVAQECSHLQTAFSTPPNVLDDFIQYREVMHRDMIARLQARLDAERQVAVPQGYQPLDVSVLEPLAWAEDSTAGQVSNLLQVGAGIKLVYQQQERMAQALWRLVRTQAQQSVLETERLRQQEAGYQRRIFELEQAERQLHQQLEQERLQWQQQHNRLMQEKERIVGELHAVYQGTIWRATEPVRLLADRSKPLLRKVREGGSAWIRLTPESRPRRTARKLKLRLQPMLGRVLRKGKQVLTRNQIMDKYLQTGLNHFPVVRQWLRQWAGETVQESEALPADLSYKAADIYRRLQSKQ